MTYLTKVNFDLYPVKQTQRKNYVIIFIYIFTFLFFILLNDVFSFSEYITSNSTMVFE